jgi:hypothetical protein
MGEGEGVDEEPNHTTRENLVLYKTFNILSYIVTGRNTGLKR